MRKESHQEILKFGGAGDTLREIAQGTYALWNDGNDVNTTNTRRWVALTVLNAPFCFWAFSLAGAPVPVCVVAALAWVVVLIVVRINGGGIVRTDPGPESTT